MNHEFCSLESCPVCLELAHENCEEDCRYCCEMAMRREVSGYAEAQAAYYAPGSVFDNLFAGMEET